jgi:hypothetical protein
MRARRRAVDREVEPARVRASEAGSERAVEGPVRVDRGAEEEVEYRVLAGLGVHDPGLAACRRRERGLRGRAGLGGGEKEGGADRPRGQAVEGGKRHAGAEAVARIPRSALTARITRASAFPAGAACACTCQSVPQAFQPKAMQRPSEPSPRSNPKWRGQDTERADLRGSSDRMCECGQRRGWSGAYL